MRGSRASCGTSGRPEAAAISITAVRLIPDAPPSMRYSAVIGTPSGSVTMAWRSAPAVAATSACTVPSPPSATGTTVTLAEGSARWMPRAMAAPTSGASRLPLSAWGATTILTASARLTVHPAAAARGDIPGAARNVGQHRHGHVIAGDHAGVEHRLQPFLGALPGGERRAAVGDDLPPDLVVAGLSAGTAEEAGHAAEHLRLTLPVKGVFTGVGVLGLMLRVGSPCPQPINCLFARHKNLLGYFSDALAAAGRRHR